MILDKETLGVTFSRSFLKLLLSNTPIFLLELLFNFFQDKKNLTIDDLEDSDPTTHKNLLWMLENDISEFDQTFWFFIYNFLFVLFLIL